ncbi:hypothetical protein ABFS83_06G168300 [Erythranthe nasuta]
MEPNFMDEIDCGNFFDQIDDLIEFPPDNEDVGGIFVNSDSSKDFPSMWNDDALPESDHIFSANAASDLSAELSVPYEDIVQLEWLSTFVEDSFSGGGMTIAKENLREHKNEPTSHTTYQFQTSSPVSVLESTSSSSSTTSAAQTTAHLPPTHRGPQRARSKRPRPSTFNPRPTTIPSFVDTTPQFSSETENFVKEAPPLATNKIPKRKKMKKTPPSNREDDDNEGGAKGDPPVRKCKHCEITKTPQWRAGPTGPKTLCNACGVRYKSGRLFPEYRPAASPTFVPALHSNSHKKVVEMRTKVGPAKPELDASF